MSRTLLVLALLIAAQAPGRAAQYPPAAEFVAQVRAALSDVFDDPPGVTYLEHRRDVKISRLGRITVGPLRTFEVHPSPPPGRTYKRLLAVDGQPLAADELARRDAEHARHQQEAAARAARAGEAARTAERRAHAEDRREQDAILDDAVRVYAASFAGRDTIDGRDVLLVDVQPRADIQPGTRQGRWMQHFAGRIWVDEVDFEIVRLEMHAVRDITVGWGVVGRIDEGSRVVFSSRRFEDRWVPAQLSYEARGRTLLVRPFRFAVTTTYSDYRRS